MSIAGQIEYKVTVDTSGLKSGLNEAKNQASNFSSTLATVGKSGGKLFAGAMIAGVTTATTAIIGVTQKAVKNFADYEQLVGGVETLFKDSSDTVMGYAEQAYRTAGLSANQYMEQATAFSASLLQSLGGNTEEAAKVTDMAITDMADNANKMGTSIENIQNAYQGFAKQNYTMLDNLKLGYGGTKTEMERLLADAEKISGVKYDINNLDDVFQAIHVIQGELGITGTTAEEAENTISGSLGMMKSSWENLTVAIAKGDNLDEPIKQFMDSAGTLIQNLLPVVKTALIGVVQMIGQIAPDIIAILPELISELLPAIIEASVALMQAIVDNLPALIQVFIDNIPLIVDGLVQIVTALIPLLPQILILLAQALITTIVSLLVSLAPRIGQAFADIFSGIGSFFGQVLSFFGDFADNAIKGFTSFADGIGEGLQNIGKWFADVFQGAYNFVTGIFSNIGNFFKGVWDKIASIFTGIGNTIGTAVEGAFKATVNGILSFIEGFVNTPINILNNFIDAINWAFGFIGVNLGKIGNVSLPRMATGGIVPSTNGGQLILAGEGGQDEWVVPESKMASLIEQIQQNNGQGLGNVTINVYGTFATSETEQRRVAEQIHEKLQEINKARMGVYL